jgi:N-hydroxyarylamine O-acetyltransferase
MSESIDLDAYFRRIGYDGPRQATLEVLRALHRLHPRFIPFENLDVLLGRGVRVDIGSVQAKLVQGGRGGYCFEHNHLFSAVLKALGFPVVDLAARVLWNRPADVAAPRTHRLLKVGTPEGFFQADVGFGGVTQTAPLRFEAGAEADTGEGAFRLVDAGAGELQLQFRLPAGWAPVYQFAETPQQPVDYELANWFVSTHPSSPFVGSLMAAWVGENGRYAVYNNELSVYPHGGGAEKRELSAAELESLLHDTFGLARPADADLAAVYSGLPRRVRE